MNRTLLVFGAVLSFAMTARAPLRKEPEGLAAAPDIALAPVAAGIGPITAIANAGDARLFLTVQTGGVLIFSGGQVQPVAFLDLAPLVSCCGERGLLGITFHPQYAANRFFFVDYTNTAGNTVIARYQASLANANMADPASGVILLTITQPFPNHNGGQLQFGPDGYLYVADVGQNASEEIDFQPGASAGGENYGWKIMEGTLCGAGGSSGCPAGVPTCHSPSFKSPLYEYLHVGSGSCTGTVIGGYVYRGAAYPQLAGVYLYGDYCFGWLFGSGQMLSPSVPQLTTFGEDASGEVYLGTEDGRLYRIVSPAIPTPTPPSPRTPPVLSLRLRPSPRVITRPPT